MRIVVSLIVSLGLILTVAPGAQANPGEPRYCLALIDALAAAPDPSLFPMNTAKKRRLVEAATRKQSQLFARARLIAKADGDVTVANGLYWVARSWRGNEQRAYKEFQMGDAQAKSDCGIGFI